jgi:hypothetical protein
MTDMDERFVMHRFKSTRLATLVGVVMMALWFNYELLVNDVWRFDLLIILGAMALAKVGALLYYRFTN